MQAPSSDELRRIAKYDVGDKVHLHFNAVWVVTRRYYSKREGRIYYDILFEYTGVTSERVKEDALRPA